MGTGLIQVCKCCCQKPESLTLPSNLDVTNYRQLEPFLRIWAEGAPWYPYPGLDLIQGKYGVDDYGRPYNLSVTHFSWSYTKLADNKFNVAWTLDSDSTGLDLNQQVRLSPGGAAYNWFNGLRVDLYANAVNLKVNANGQWAQKPQSWIDWYNTYEPSKPPYVDLAHEAVFGLGDGLHDWYENNWKGGYGVIDWSSSKRTYSDNSNPIITWHSYVGDNGSILYGTYPNQYYVQRPQRPRGRVHWSIDVEICKPR